MSAEKCDFRHIQIFMENKLVDYGCLHRTSESRNQMKPAVKSLWDKVWQIMVLITYLTSAPCNVVTIIDTEFLKCVGHFRGGKACSCEICLLLLIESSRKMGGHGPLLKAARSRSVTMIEGEHARWQGGWGPHQSGWQLAQVPKGHRYLVTRVPWYGIRAGRNLVYLGLIAWQCIEYNIHTHTHTQWVLYRYKYSACNALKYSIVYIRGQGNWVVCTQFFQWNSLPPLKGQEGHENQDNHGNSVKLEYMWVVGTVWFRWWIYARVFIVD